MGAVHVLTIVLGYLALGLLAVSLVIGPLGLLGRRRNPVNISLRRDIGIWVGVTGLGHVLCGLQVHLGGQILLYFVQERAGRLVPLLNLFGISNDLGLLATVLLLFLLALSNDLALRRLRGPRWKWLQRTNYLLFLLVVLHTFGYQLLIQREAPFVWLAVGLVATVLLAQAGGLLLYRARHTRRPP
jgi:sulfoxide reductase heme-binding subunit YedZ